jgi:hypothetical protein
MSKENNMQKNNLTKKNNSQKESVTSLLKKTGLLMPSTEDEVEANEKIFGDTKILLPESVSNPDNIWEQIKDDVSISENSFQQSAKVVSIVPNTKSKKATGVNTDKKNDYFKKLVLAAEIANQLHNEPTFGHKKFVKIEYLCTEICNMQLSSNYGKYAAGPLDPKHMYSVDAEFKKRKWFEISKRTGGYGYKYSQGENIEEYKKYYSNYFRNQFDLINRLISLFRKMDSAFCEIVATLFFVWKENLQNNKSTTDEFLMKGFYQWGEGKKNFTKTQLTSGLDWMRANQIIPVI